MSPRLPVLKPREVLRALQRAGFEIHHQSGSHAQLRHPDKPHLRVTVPRHDRFDLPTPVLKSILRQAELSVEEFLHFC
ncbi:MAG TPA: type II toxin-antitoxin system HicA family toxin [Verrucomicrobiae bacterium]|nr:type II toxin-antitoxin system HicA family toxin [Verrucomicrobiae bacterium]